MSRLPSRSALVLSTTPPYPRDYGNRNRVFQTTSFLQSLGFEISFILYPLDSDWQRDIPPYYSALAAQFAYFSVVPNSRPLHQLAADGHHALDEWWDETLALQLTWLFARKSFDLVMVNYTFLSKALELAPRHALRVLDTHDIFSGRRELFEANDVSPEFFYTTRENEAAAYARADAVLAIKESEATFIRSLSKGKTICIPYFDAQVVGPRESQRTFDVETPLRLGFIGARNSVNLVNLKRFLKIVARYVLLYDPPVRILVAGDVCQGLDVDYPFVQILGRVADVAEFYAAIDAALVPFEFSTGSKIKVGEALAHHVPVLATQNAFDGYRDFHRSQVEPDFHALADRVVSVAWGETPFRDLINAAMKSARAGFRAQQRGFDEFGAWLLAGTPRMIVVVDRPFWKRETFADEVIVQWLEYLAHICRIVLCCVGTGEPRLDGLYARVDVRPVAVAEALPALLTEIGQGFAGKRHVTLLVGEATRALCAAVTADTMPLWSLTVAPAGVNTGLVFEERRSGARLPVAALRHRPLTSTSLGGEARRLTLFQPRSLSEWQALAARYVRLFAGELGYTVGVVFVSGRLEDCPALYEAATRDMPPRGIALVDDLFWGALLEDLYARTDSRLMLVHPDFCSPECRVGDVPSLAASIRAFLSGEAVAAPPPSVEGGWGAVWDALAAKSLYGPVVEEVL
jgi:glycosyltransferase involved in cell wall biosynthesis